MATFVRVAKTSDVQPGEGRVVVVQGHPVALFNVKGRFYAVSNVCLHRGGPIGEGMLDDAVVTCPNHGWNTTSERGRTSRTRRPASGRSRSASTASMSSSARDHQGLFRAWRFAPRWRSILSGSA